MIELVNPTPETLRTTEVARTSLVAINWDGDNPMPVVGLIYALINELEASGHSRRSMGEMLKGMGRAWQIR
jgi:hypothetical protein